MNKKLSAFFKWPNDKKKVIFICLYLAVFFNLSKKILSLEALLDYSRKPLAFGKSTFSEKNLIETHEMINKISRNFINISCLSKVLIIKKYFADSERLVINIGIRSVNDNFESHAWINHESYLKLENDEFMSFEKLYEYC